MLIIHCGTSYINDLIYYLNKSNIPFKIFNFEEFTIKLENRIKNGINLKMDLDINEEEFSSFNSVIYAGGTIRGSIIPGLYREIKLWSMNFIRNLKVPFLGICLGHMMLSFSYGATYTLLRERARNPIREEKGVKKIIFHKEFPLAPGKNNLVVYEDHEREISKLPSCLINTATSKDSEIQAIYHLNEQKFGVQFHPEVPGTEGWIIIHNFLKLI